MQQPSAQGIASLYRGNPAPLQQSIQKEQQAKPGLPPDLQKMLALQIVNNEKDSVTAQKAMDQLQQMNGQQGGKPPTVMQSLEQQARQKMQAQAVQAQQKQQGIQALMQQAPAGPVPEGTPQPEMQPQPQGIDQSDRVAFAGAEGGIVAFQSRGEVPETESEGLGKYADAPILAAELGVPVLVYRRAADLAARMGTTVGEVLKTMGKDAVSATARGGASTAKNLAKAGMSGAAGAVLAGGIPATQFAGDVIRSASPEKRKEFYENPMVGAMSGDTGLAAAIMNASEEGQAQRDRKQVATATDNRAALNKADAGIRSAPAARPAPPVRDLKELNTQRVNAARPPAAAQPPAPPPPPPPPAPEVVEPTAAEKVLNARVAADPAAQKLARQTEMDTELGRPDTAQHDRLIAELEKRKQSLAPKQGFEGLMEYLGQVSANSQPGRGSFASGAAGARGMDKLNKERQLEQFELSKQAIEVSQKKLDTVRAYAEKRFNVGNAEFDKVYKEQFEAAKEVVKNRADAEKLAKENTIKMLQMQNNLDVQALQNKGSLAAASVRSEGNEGKRQVEVLKAELASIDKELAKLLPIPYGTNKAKIAALEAQKAQVQKDLRAAGGVSTMGAAPGAPKGPGGTNQQNWSIKPLQ
jgi:hypothetical protein